jgi:pyruvate kinase
MIKVIPTIGPASEELKDIKFLQNYTNIFRLNSSHNTIKWHKSISDKIKLSSRKNKILIDIPGIKPRTSNTADIKIKKNERILFYYKIKPNIKNNISKFIPLSNPIPQIKKKVTFFSISDGSFEFKATGKSKNYIIGTSKQSFVLKKNKGLNIPLSVYSDNLQKKKYLFFLKAINRLNYDAVGLSFVQNHNIVNFIKNKYPKKIIVSKIENYEGLRNAKEICEASDVIMVDRGDLSAEIGNDNLFDAIIKISKLCENLHKPLIMATENLDSMISNKMPTKSEIFTLAYYKKINIDSIMLSDETATAVNWKNIVIWVKKFFKGESKLEIPNDNNLKFWDIIKNEIKIPVVIFSKKGFSMKNVENLSYYKNVTVFTESKKVKLLCEFKKNLNVILTKKFDNKNLLNFIKKNIKKNYKEIFKKFNSVLVFYISYPRKKSRVNTMILISKDDFI